jgi:hypothetical protein
MENDDKNALDTGSTPSSLTNYFLTTTQADCASIFLYVCHQNSLYLSKHLHR